MAKNSMTLEEKLEDAIVKDAPYEVPENWMWSKIKFVGNIKGGKRLPKGKQLLDFKTNYPYIRVADFDSGTIDIEGIKYLDEESYSQIKNYTIISNDVYVSIAGTIGKVGIIPEILDGANLTENAAKITDIKVISNKYLYYLLSSEKFQRYMQEASIATTQAKLALNKIADLIIPIPPLKEQQRIVDRMESLFEKLDKAKELIEEARKGFGERKAAILEKAFRGELTKRWREENSVINSYDTLLNEIEKRKGLYSIVKKKDIPNFMNYDMNDILVEDSLPSTWIKCPIGLICDCIVPGRDKPKSFTGDIPWITTPNLTSDVININSSELKLSENEIAEVKSKIIPINSVVMSCVGRFGISAVIADKCVINQQLHAFLPSKLIDEKYLMYHVKVLRWYMEEIATSTTIAYVNKAGCNSLPINLAPIEEQKEIVKRLDKLLEEESKIEELTQLEEQIALIKKSILAKAFRGKIGTNCEEDESALELLKEILSEN